MPSEHFIGKVGAKAIIARDGKVLMVRAHGENAWDLPGGRINAGETLAEALVRELKEELGVAASVGRFVHSSQVVHSHDRTNQLFVTYEAALTDPAAPFVADPAEAGELRWVGTDELAGLASYDNCLSALREYWNIG